MIALPSIPEPKNARFITQFYRGFGRGSPRILGIYGEINELWSTENHTRSQNRTDAIIATKLMQERCKGVTTDDPFARLLLSMDRAQVIELISDILFLGSVTHPSM